MYSMQHGQKEVQGDPAPQKFIQHHISMIVIPREKAGKEEYIPNKASD